MSRVCVTGAAGYIASWLVKKLLDRGCTVHGTVRNLGDEKKTELLRGLPGAAERLVLFEADIYDAASFEPAIQGCEFVFLVATPLQHNSGSSKYKDTTEATLDATRTILQQCERSKTVKRVIHTGSVVTASPLREDGDGYKEFVNESCWTPLGLSCDHSNEYMDFLQALLGSVPLVHVDDVCEAHVFCMEKSSDVVGGRYLCTTAHTNMHDILEHYARMHPELERIKEVVGEGLRVQANTNKLVELGFKYKYGAEEVLDGSVDCGKRLGLL
ncbi:hypothetical protein CFC21_022582 [Triticum aestivum]|uniref:NAD-dependent epimerase/dehydratase domain-containing protein n=3 Tax=Triticum TaxID=4564 RepID=A0A9R1PII9_TRITD|nr:dihydroflavonol 4-reductase-like isoform X4 [Triticum dicoccoides]XP_044322931.1 dihydroflavonol 4-reductase-like isoform X4 [Triticum aestivum]KAF7007664.1 hypothetical protein CFC21_022582 [Triticum aestivum]VAH44054.1 unnamed protein product [Triticum turgidum subsp. durum]